MEKLLSKDIALAIKRGVTTHLRLRNATLSEISISVKIVSRVLSCQQLR